MVCIFPLGWTVTFVMKTINPLNTKEKTSSSNFAQDIGDNNKMGFQLSPGISISEYDLTTIVPAVATTIGAIAGPFRWGPANVPTLVQSEENLALSFGYPDNETANTWFTASSFLAYANALQTVRVIRATGVFGAGASATAVAANSTTINVTVVSGGSGYGTTLPLVV